MRFSNSLHHLKVALIGLEGEAKRLKFLRHRNASNTVQGAANELRGVIDRLEAAAAETLAAE